MSFFGSLFGTDAKKAAEQAAADTYAKQTAATNDYLAFGNSLPGSYASLSTAYDPYRQAGQSALDQLLAGLGLGGDQAAFTKAYQSLPGYQSGLDTGTQAAMRGLNAGPGLQSGGALKALQRYGSDYENQRVGDYLSRLMGLTNTSQSATGSAVNTQAQGLQGQQGVRQSAYTGQLQSAPTIGQGMVAGANAESQAITNLLSTVGNVAGKVLPFML